MRLFAPQDAKEYTAIRSGAASTYCAGLPFQLLKWTTHGEESYGIFREARRAP